MRPKRTAGPEPLCEMIKLLSPCSITLIHPSFLRAFYPKPSKRHSFSGEKSMTLPLPPSLPPSSTSQSPRPSPGQGPARHSGSEWTQQPQHTGTRSRWHYAVRLTMYTLQFSTDRSGSFNSYNTLTVMACCFSWLFVSLISMQLMSGIINKKR